MRYTWAISLILLFNFAIDGHAASSCRELFAQTAPVSLVQRQVETFRRLWDQSKIGVSISEMMKQIQSVENESVQNTLTQLRQQKLAVTMVAPSSIREEIVQFGFLNVHATNVSRGSNEIAGRSAIEASFSGMSTAEYMQLPDQLKPKYAFLSRRLFESKAASYPQQYGDDIFVFKNKNLEKRMTFTIGDSLNYVGSKEAYQDGLDYAKPEKLIPDWTKGIVPKAKNIYDVYIPFKFKNLIALFLLNTRKDQDSIRIQGAGLTKTKMPPHFYDNSYIEVQIWGGIDLSHVESFTFRNRPPAGPFLAALKKNGVQIYDGRNRLHTESNRNSYDQSQIKLWDEANESGVYFEPSGMNEGYWVQPQIASEKQAAMNGTEKYLTEAFQSSTDGHWVKDDNGVGWFEKHDVIHPELQTSAEAIASRIYRLFGFNVPQTHKIKRGGQFFSISKYIGESSVATNLSEFNAAHDRSLRVIAAYLKDWDRWANPDNNRKTADGRYFLIDFGGALGSRARGEFKEGMVISEAIGALDTGATRDIYRSYQINLPKNHPWMKISAVELGSMAERLQIHLTDGALFDIVHEAQFSKKEDELKMFEILKQRRDNLIAELIEISGQIAK